MKNASIIKDVLIIALFSPDEKSRPAMEYALKLQSQIAEVANIATSNDWKKCQEMARDMDVVVFISDEMVNEAEKMAGGIKAKVVLIVNNLDQFPSPPEGVYLLELPDSGNIDNFAKLFTD